MIRRDFCKLACLAPFFARGSAAGTSAPAEPLKAFVLGTEGKLLIPRTDVEKPLRFFVIGDTHFALHDGRDDAYRDNYSRMAARSGSKEAFEKVLAKAKAKKADLVCLVGDIVSFPTLANVEYVTQALKASGVPWLYVAGNHDWHFEGVPGSDAAQRAEWAPKRLAPLFQGRSPFCSSVVVKGVRFVAIDNSIYHVTEEQLEFWKAEVAKGDPIVLLMHIPLWMESMGLFTCGCPKWGAAADPYWQIERREKWAERQSPATFAFREAVLSARNLVGVFTGHLHTTHVAHTPGNQLLFTVPTGRAGQHWDVKLGRNLI